jgi:hypothetical protein
MREYEELTGMEALGIISDGQAETGEEVVPGV